MWNKLISNFNNFSQIELILIFLPSGMTFQELLRWKRVVGHLKWFNFLNWFNSYLSVNCWFGPTVYSLRYSLYCNLTDLAVLLLLLCHFCHQSNFIHWECCLQFKLVWLSSTATKVHHFDSRTLSTTNLFHWARHHSVYDWNIRSSKFELI